MESESRGTAGARRLKAGSQPNLPYASAEAIDRWIPARRSVLALVLEWASEHRSELMEDWQLCASMQLPKKIAPLG